MITLISAAYYLNRTLSGEAARITEPSDL